MLQQTQVATVIPYFMRFVRRFPTLVALKNATETEVLAHWQGLGYYRRAKMLHALACSIGKLPNQACELMKLPGIGEYTANAIACFAYGEQVAAVDGNAKRVIARLFASKKSGTDLHKYANDKAIELIEFVDARDLNQALMDLGSTVCTPKNPSCNICPLRRECRANELGVQHACPVAVQRPSSIAVNQTGLVCIQRRRIGFVRDESKWWRGLYHLPRLSDDESAPRGAQIFGTITHTVTHHKICLTGMYCRQRRPGMTWFAADDLDDVPLPAPDRKLLALLPMTVFSR